MVWSPALSKSSWPLLLLVGLPDLPLLLVPPAGPPPLVAHRGRNVHVRDGSRVGELEHVRFEEADLVVSRDGGVGGAEDRPCARGEA